MEPFRYHPFLARNRFRPKLSIGFAALATCLIGVSGCGMNGEDGGFNSVAVADEAVAVDATVAQAGTLEDALVYTGTTQPVQQVALRSRVDGQVTALTVDVGDAVTDGDVLARLDTDLLTVEVNQAQAELRARQAEVAQARAAVSDVQTALESARVSLQQAQIDADRLSRLAAEGAISVQEAEQAQLSVETGQQVLQSAAEQVRTRQAAVNAAEDRVSAQQAIVDQALERLSYAVVQSPLTGVVIERLVESGDYVESGDELMQVGDLRDIKVRIDVSDLDLAAVSLGQPVEVRLDALPNQVLSGRVTRIAPAADASSRLVPVEITVPNESGRIGSGFLARVTLTGEGGDLVAIPKDALTVADTPESPAVFVVQDVSENEGVVQIRSLELGRETTDRVEVLSGLQAGETYVVRSGGALSDGQTVRLSILSEIEDPG